MFRHNAGGHISKKHFRPGRMAASERTLSVRAVKDTPMAECSAPGINTTCRVAHRPPIAVSLFHLTLSVSYFNETLWRCSQLWPYVGMGSLGTRLGQDCNAMGDAAKISPPVPSTFSSRCFGRRREHMILPIHKDSRYWVDPRNLGEGEWDQKLGKTQGVFSLYDKMRWKWDAVYLPWGLLNIYSASLIEPPLPLYLRTPTVTP